MLSFNYLPYFQLNAKEFAPMKMRLLVTGDREWKDKASIHKLLLQYFDWIEVVIEGEARGVDKLTRECCEEIGINFLPFPYIGSLGRAGGVVRNQQMIDEGRPTNVWAFHDHIESSKGTKDMMLRASYQGIPVRHWKHGVTTGRKELTFVDLWKKDLKSKQTSA